MAAASCNDDQISVVVMVCVEQQDGKRKMKIFRLRGAQEEIFLPHFDMTIWESANGYQWNKWNKRKVRLNRKEPGEAASSATPSTI